MNLEMHFSLTLLFGVVGFAIFANGQYYNSPKNYNEANGKIQSRNVGQNCYIKRNEQTLKVTGIVVKLSDLKLDSCSEELKVIEIFAIEKVIIDKDVLLIGRGIQMVIIAPIWEVTTINSRVEISGHRVINLSGKSGIDFEPKQARNGTPKGNRNGAHGRAGLPGGPAGSFYGIADKIINADKLIVLANGGKGGNGQHGGNGAEGANGFTYQGYPQLSCVYRVTLQKWNYSLVDSSHTFFSTNYYYTYKVVGKEAKKGGSGGNGGIKGTGGHKGIATILELSNQYKNQFNLSALDGAVGKGGMGGKFALGGKNGKNVNVTLTCGVNNVRQYEYVDNPKILPTDTGRAERGLDGISGTSLKRKIDTERLQFINIFPTSVNEYKIFLRPHLSDSNSTEEMKKWSFYNHLNTEENIIKMYDALSLVEDFIGLEKQFFSLNNKINFTSSYEQLINRIVEYMERPLSQKNTEYMNIIGDLKSDVSDRLKIVQSINVPYDVNTDFVTEDERNLLRKVTDLKDFRKTNNILYLLQKNVRSVDQNMKNGTKLIESVVINAITEFEETLDEDLDSLLIEITEMEAELFVNQTELEKNREKLEKIMQLKLIFGILEVGCGALDVINPALGIVGGIASSAISVFKAKTTEDKEGYVTVLPKAVETLAKQSEDYFNELKKNQEKVLEEQEKFIITEKKSATLLGINIINGVWDSTQEYRSQDKNSLVSNSGYQMQLMYARKETELTTELKKLEASGEKENSIKKKGVEHGLKVAKYLKATSVAFKTGSETVLSIMKDETKIAEIDKAIKKNEGAIKALELMEENIFNTVKPLLSSMQTNLDAVERDVQNMNTFQQAIAKWNVTRTIEEIKHTLHNITKNFNIDEKMTRSFRDLINTFDLLFEEHNLLMQSKDAQKNTIDQTILHIAHDSILHVSDPDLRYALSELEFVKRSNYVAETYHKWFSALKQHAFPYYGEKLIKLQDLLEFSQHDGISKYANYVIKNINDLTENSHTNIFTDHKQKIPIRGSNSPDMRSRFSFYTWRKGEKDFEITRILNGTQTKLVADVQNGNFDYEAIKFNRVKLLFTTTSDHQEELNSELKNFDVNFMHLGDSKYNYGKSIYEMKTSLTNMTFNYDVNDTSKESHLVTRLAKGPYLLSPYATWIVKLVPIHNDQKFDSLMKFKDAVNLELIGDAEFTSKADCDLTCKNAMQKYYTITERS